MPAMASPPGPPPCPFCEIIAGRLESSPVYEDDQVVAFLDINPVTRGHLLVVPRAHAARLSALDPGTGASLFAVAHRIALALYAADLPCEGVNLFLADGEAAGQEVDHVHLHVIPRVTGDGFRIEASGQQPGRPELDATAGQIRIALAADIG
jgi:histidine triad (HIT) family protein